MTSTLIIDNLEYVKTSQGALIAINNKQQPCPVGYEPDNLNKKIFWPKLVDCSHRVMKKMATGCPKSKLYCKHVNQWITKTICHNCRGNLQWIEGHYNKSLHIEQKLEVKVVKQDKIIKRNIRKCFPPQKP